MKKTTPQERKMVVKQAIANEQLEGLSVSKEPQTIADNYIVGKASARHAANMIRVRYGIIVP
jgi:hypothetical protein